MTDRHNLIAAEEKIVHESDNAEWAQSKRGMNHANRPLAAKPSRNLLFIKNMSCNFKNARNRKSMLKISNGQV